MGSKIPDILKSQDISRFAQRAAQVEKAKPVIAYWCMLTNAAIKTLELIVL